MAVPLNGFIYAWGEKDIIQSTCADRNRGEIMIAPFTRESLMKTSVFKEFLLKTLTAIIGSTHSLSYSKDKIWDTDQQIIKQIGQRNIIAYRGCSLTFL